jgi:hypothetical protein
MCEPQVPGEAVSPRQKMLSGARAEVRTAEVTFAGLARRCAGRDIHSRLAVDHDIFLRHRDGDGFDYTKARVSIRRLKERRAFGTHESRRASCSSCSGSCARAV